MNGPQRRIVVASTVGIALALSILIFAQRSASAADAERDQAVAVATTFAKSASRVGTPVLSTATKGGTDLLLAARADVPPDLSGKQFWVITFVGDFAPLRPPPPGASAKSANTIGLRSLTVYVLGGKVVGGTGGP